MLHAEPHKESGTAGRKADAYNLPNNPGLSKVVANGISKAVNNTNTHWMAYIS